jgi:PII-like signaling protein
VSEIRTLTVYFAERQRSGDRFLAEALLDLFEQRRVATSVMLRGIAGFGPAHLIRSDRSLSLSEDPPVALSAIDTAHRIGALAEEVAARVDRCVITVERGHLLPGPQTDAQTVRLSLHLGRRHRIAGAPGYIAVCAVLHRHGFAGADVYLGVDGTVTGQRRRARFFSRNADVPLSVAGVGTAAAAEAAVDELSTLLPDAMFTVEPTLVCKSDGRRLADPAAADGPFCKLAVHASESSRHDGRPIHRALIQQLKDSEHASGATALRAIWGFRGAERPHGDRFLQLARHVPVTTIILDTAPNIAACYPIVDEMTADEGLVTCEVLPALLEVHAGRSHGALDLGDDSTT